MTRNYTTIAIITEYWKPGCDYLAVISNAVRQRLRSGDVLVLSEKAISVAEGQIVDEARINPNVTAKLMARVWMRFVWGFFLAPICHLSKHAVQRLRKYPLLEGAAHKQLALGYAGFLQAIRHASEGGIDVINVPYCYAALPLRHPQKISQRILEVLRKDNPNDISILIVDSDKTYTWRGIHISPRSTSIQGILCLGVLAYVLGRSLRFHPRSTPVAQSGHHLSAEEALRIAALANRARGSGAGRTAWDMAERFGVDLTKVTWESLTSIKHRPIVIVRKNYH